MQVYHQRKKQQEYFGTVTLTSGIAVLGWIFSLMGLAMQQARWSELNSNPPKNYYSLHWFVLVFNFVLIAIVIYVNVLENLRLFRQAILHMTTAAFVFTVFQLNDSTYNIAVFKSLTNDSLQLPGAALMTTGLILMSIGYIHWVGFLGALEFYDHKDWSSTPITESTKTAPPRAVPSSQLSSIKAVAPQDSSSVVVMTSE